MTNRRRILQLSAEALVLAVVFGLLAIYVGRSMYGIDVFWHIRAGQVIVQDGAIPTVDTFSAVAPDRPWTPFQWLYEVLVYGLDEAGGLPLLRVVNALVLLAGFALLYRAVRRETGPLVAIFVLLFGIVLFEDRFRVRPHVFNLLFLGMLLPTLFGGWRRIRLRGVLGVAVVSWLWANIHAGGSLLVPVTLGGLVAGAAFRLVLVDAEPPATGAAPGAGSGGGARGWWLRRDPERLEELRRTLVLFGVAVGPMLLMPGFLKGVQTAVGMYGQSMSLIPEWKDPTAYFDLLDQRGMAHYLVCGFAPYVLMLLYGGQVVFRVLRRQTADIPWAEVAVSALLLYLSQRSLRFVYLTAVPATFLLRDLATSARAAAPVWPRRAVAGAVTLLALGAFTVSYHYNIVVQRGSLSKAIARIPETIEPGRFPTEAAQFLHDAEVEGGLLHLSKWGGYLLWKLWPRMSVFSDGRGNFDLVQVGALVATHRPMTRTEMLEKAWWLYRFDVVTFPGPVFPLMRWDHERWVRIYAGVEHRTPVEVFLRNSPDNQENLKRVRAWYAAADPDPRLRSPDLATFERAVADLWGRRWLEAPAQQKRLARLEAATAPTEEPPQARVDALFERAMLYFTAYDYDRALVDLVAANGIASGTLRRPDARVLYYMGWSLDQIGQGQEALAALAAAARADSQGRPQLRGDERSRGELLLRDLLERVGPPPGAPGGPAAAPPDRSESP